MSAPGEQHPLLALPLGTVLQGRYRTGRVLGIGGFGITYQGYDLVLDIQVAIKEYLPAGLATRHKDRLQVVRTGRSQADYESGRSRFLEEARILAKLQGTAHIVSVQDHFQENNTAYFVMEYVDGMSLKAYLAAQGGKIPWRQALTILQPIMEALCQVHALGLIHRDVSPDNIYLTAGGESKLLDFGAARFSAGAAGVSVILKHGYAPQEQYSSRGSQGPWTDVYAMGATLYRAITGLLPPDSITRIHRDTLKSPSALGIALPPQLEAALSKAMAVEAEDRFPTMEAFLQAILASDRGKKRRDPLLWAAAALAACIALALGVFHLLESPQVSSPPQATAPAQETFSPLPEEDTATSGIYSNASLNCAIALPAFLEETAPGSAVFLSPDGSCTLQMGFYTYWAGFPVYTLADAEAHAEDYVQYWIGLLASTDITDFMILEKGYRQLGGQRAYAVQFAATERAGSAMEFLAWFIQGQNGFGCYNVIASYPQGDAQAREAMEAALQSFQCLGAAETSYRLFSDQGLDFQFLYADDPSWTFTVENGFLSAVCLSGGGYRTLSLSTLPLAGAQTAETILTQLTQDLDAAYPGIRHSGAPKTQRSGGMDWVTQDFTQPGEDGVALSYAVAIWDDTAYLLIASTNHQAAQEEPPLRADIMGSLRPAAGA